MPKTRLGHCIRIIGAVGTGGPWIWVSRTSDDTMAVLEVWRLSFGGCGCDGMRSGLYAWGGGDAVVGSGAEEWFEAVIGYEVDGVLSS